MSFYFGSTGTLLFPSWILQSAGDLIGGIVTTFALAVIFEGLRTLHEYLLYVASNQSARQLIRKDSVIEILPRGSTCSDEGGNCTPRQMDSKFHNWRDILPEMKKLIGLLHFVQSVLLVIRVGVGYLLMLAVMTFNGWIFLAVTFGAGVGYLAFGWTRFMFVQPSSTDGSYP